MPEQANTHNEPKVKPCRKCGAQVRYANGVCKPCAKISQRKWAAANPDKIREASLKWQTKNPETYKQSQLKSYARNADKWRAVAKKYYAENTEKALEASRKWRTANPDKMRAAVANYQAANPEVMKAHSHNRRARIKASGGVLSNDIILRLMKIQKGKCACCGKSLKAGYHLDHIMPLALGGMNVDSNMQLLTPNCNQRKSAKHPLDWAREIGRLI